MNTATAVCLTAVVIGGSASLAFGLVVTVRTFSRRRASFITSMPPPPTALLLNSASSSKTMAELKLKDQGLQVSGAKETIIQRLEDASSSEPSTLPFISNNKSKYFTATTTTPAPTTAMPMTPMKQTWPSSVTPEGKLYSSNYNDDTYHAANAATKRGGSSLSSSKSSRESSTSTRKKRIKIEPGSLTPPYDYEQIYNLVKELRSDHSAPCDTDGGEALPETHLGSKVYRYQVLTALMLSSQTKDAIVGETMRDLQKHGLTVENIHITNEITLNKLIGRVGFHNNKTKFIKQVADILISQYNGDIPPTAHEMITSLPGVGPKMAYIVESIVFGTSSGIGVDTHMHRML